MAEHQETHTIIGPFPDEDPLDTAQLFLRTNGYTIAKSEYGERPAKLVVEPLEPADPEEVASEEKVVSDEEEVASEEKVVSDEEDVVSEAEDVVSEAEDVAANEVTIRLVAERGTKWGGLFSSAMSDLQTTLTVSLIDNTVVLTYVINTTGQILSEDDRAFWGKESRALQAYIKGTDDVTNVVSGEAERARSTRRDLLTSGAWIGAVLFVLIFIAGVLMLR